MSGYDGAALLSALTWTLLVVACLLAVTFVVALRVGRHSVLDVAWGLGFAGIGATAYLLHTGDGTRAAVTAVAVALWGGRLAVHIGNRSRGHGEDPRYAEVLARAPGSPRVHAFTRLYLTQGLTMWLVSLPVQVAMFSAHVPGALLWVGLAVWAVGLGFESIADLQLHRFRRDPATAGTVLETGLWRWTRHPNYFGDATVWWGLFLMAADTGLPGWLTVASPVVMTWLLARGTGKPLLERGIGERRPGYADYVRRTSGFVPWPPKASC